MGSITFSKPGNHSWEAPAGVTSVQVECWGAGGSSQAHLGAGGGGAYAKTNNVPVVPGITYTFYVGQTYPTFTRYTRFSYFCKAVGGHPSYTGEAPELPHMSGLGGSADDCIGDTKVSGGRGGDLGSSLIAGGGGCAGADGQDGNDGGVGGKGEHGGGDGGTGGAGRTDGPGEQDGYNPGGGASGSMTGRLISGGQGQVTITWL